MAKITDEGILLDWKEAMVTGTAISLGMAIWNTTDDIADRSYEQFIGLLARYFDQASLDSLQTALAQAPGKLGLKTTVYKVDVPTGKTHIEKDETGTFH